MKVVFVVGVTATMFAGDAARATHPAEAVWVAPSLPSFAQSTTVVDELLATDRAYSAASLKTDVITGLSEMFATSVTTPVPCGPAASTP